MKNFLYLIIFILGLLIAQNAFAGIIFKPVFQAGLVGYWNFDEGAGGVVYDRSGYGNHGTWIGTAGILSEGFEANPGYDMTGWSETVGAGSVVDEDNTEVARPTGGGNQVLKIQKVSPNFDARTYRSFAQPKPVTFIAFNIYITEADVDTWASNPLAKVFSNLGENVWEIKVEKYPSYYNFLFGITYESSWHAGRYENFSFNTWYLIEVKYDATNKKAEFRVNGNSISTFSWSGDTYADINVLNLGDTDVSKVLTAYYDSVKVSTTGWNQGYWANGKIGEGGSFNGSDDYVEIADASDLSFGNSSTDTPMTISAWIKMTDATEFKIFEKGEYSSTIEYYFRLGDEGSEQDNLMLRVYDSSTGAALGREYSTPVTAYEGQWIHVVATYDGSATTAGIKLYLNGVRVDDADYNYSSGYVAMENLGAPAWIARYTSYYSNGLIDEMRVYNRVLNASEVERVYKLSQPKILAAPRNGLVGYWSFNEGSGTKVHDYSGNGNTGTFSGSMAQTDWINGKLGKALNLNGDGKNVYFGSPASLQLGNTGTISAWLKYSTIPHHAGVVSKNDWGNDRDGYNIGIGAGDQKPCGEIADGLGYNQVCTTRALNDNEWHHLVFTWDGSFLRIYVDNVSDATPLEQNLTPVSNVYDLYIGRIAAPVYADYNYHGQIDEVRIYNRDLDLSEITALYNSGLQKINSSQNNQITNGLVGLWSFNGPDIDGNEAYDRSGQGNTGTIIGAVPINGKVGQALSFDGTDDWVDITDSPTYENVSFSAWVYYRGSPDYAAIVSNGDGILRNVVFYNTTFMVHDGSWREVTGLPINTWRHVALTFIGSTKELTLYVNGVQRYNGIGTAYSNGGFSTIGAYDGGSAWFFNGLIDEVRVYNRALTAQEILRLYNLGH